MYSSDELKTGADYWRAAMILQHGKAPEDFLLAHELCLRRRATLDVRDRTLEQAGPPRAFPPPHQGGTPLEQSNGDSSRKGSFGQRRTAARV
jgi:hypothetical protein